MYSIKLAHEVPVKLLFADSNGNNYVGVLFKTSTEDAYIFSDCVDINGSNPPTRYEYLKKYGHNYSWFIGRVPETLNPSILEPYIGCSIQVIDFRDMGEMSSKKAPSHARELLKFCISDLKPGEAIPCSISTDTDKALFGVLFKNSANRTYILHNNCGANGNAVEPFIYDKSGHKYSWELSGNLVSDVQIDSFVKTGDKYLLHNYNVAVPPPEPKVWTIEDAVSVCDSNYGVAVDITINDDRRMQGIMVLSGKEYYLLHNNEKCNGGRPPHNRITVPGYVHLYSWYLGPKEHIRKATAVFTVKNINGVHIHREAYPEQKSTGVSVHITDSSGSTFTLSKDGEATSPKEELIMFKKKTSKVARCTVEPMQSPQIIKKK